MRDSKAALGVQENDAAVAVQTALQIGEGFRGGLLGGGMLNDISLSLFVGLTAGAYSSIMIATPLVADFPVRRR